MSMHVPAARNGDEQYLGKSNWGLDQNFDGQIYELVAL